MSQSFSNLVNHETSQEAMDIANFLYNAIQGSPTLPYNSGAFGLVGDGVTDNTTNFQNAIDSFGAQGGAIILAPGVYVTGPLTLASQVHIIGSGIESTIIQLKAGANGDLLSADVSSINLSAPYGTGSGGGVNNFSIRNITLDGNKANQTGGTSYVLRFYGYAYILDNIRIRNGFSGGVLVDWNGGFGNLNTSNDPEFQISNFHIHDNGGMGLEIGGPSDSQIVQGEIYRNASHSLHLAPNAQAMQIMQIHCYSETHGNNAVAYLLEGSSSCFVNCEAEGSDVVEVVFLANQLQWRGGRIFTAGLSVSGIQIGQQAGNTPYPGEINQSGGFTTAVAPQNYDVDTRIYNCEGPNGSIWFANDGEGQIIADITNITGPYIGGTRLSSTTILLNGKGLTSDGTLPKTPAFLLQNAGVRGGTIGWAKSSSVQTLSNGTNISILGSGYARVTEAAAVTGITVSQGAFDGQSLWVVNEANFTITFAAAGSHVADGSTSPIPGLAARLFVYDVATGLWYRAA